MKTSSFALLSAIIPIISSLALPEPEFSYPEGVTAAVVTDFEYPGKVPVGVEKREIATLEKRADHGVYFCKQAQYYQELVERIAIMF
jgi:hypothetical protein